MRRSMVRSIRPFLMATVASVLLAVPVTGPAAGPWAPRDAAAAGTPVQWIARFGASSSAGSATIRALPSGSGSVYLQQFGLRPGTSHAVRIVRGTCAAAGATIVTLAAVTADRSGTVVRTSTLTAGQVATIKVATTGTGRISIRVGTGTAARCAAFARAATPARTHRIAVRVVDGVGEFYDRVTGTRFVPRGANYIRVASQPQDFGGTFVYHSTFDRGRYDPLDAEANLRRMQADGFTVVRVFLNYSRGEGLGDAHGLSPGYLDNFIDFLQRARAHHLYVMPTLDFLPYGRYDGPSVDGIGGTNWSFLAGPGVAADALFWSDLAHALLDRGAPMDALWGFELRNELSFASDAPPFSLTSGLVTTANGSTYDLSIPAEKDRLMDEGLVWWIDHVRAALRKVDPTALVAVGFFQPQAPNPTRLGDPRIIRTQPALADSAADFIDLHAYPGVELTLDQYVENFGLAAARASRPVVMGEFGAFRSAYPTEAAAAWGLADWQVASCAHGFAGWLVWPWDRDTELYAAHDGSGLVERALAPSTRPDACAPGSIGTFLGPGHDLSLNATATASSTEPGHDPSLAVDGLAQSAWSAGSGPPSWIEIDLGAAHPVAEIRLLVAQYPDGMTDHRVLGRSDTGTWTLVCELNGVTHDDTWLTCPAGGATLRAVRVGTVTSPSWVSWREIQVIEAVP